MEADLKFLLVYWGVCIFVASAFLLFVTANYVMFLAVGVVLGFACAMTIVFVQERAEDNRYHYGKH